MKKFLLFILLCGAPAKSMDTDSLSLFDTNTYKIMHLKHALRWCMRVAYQGGKVYLGSSLWKMASVPIYLMPSRGTCLFYRASGGVFVLHGLQGLMRELGYNSAKELFRHLEGKDNK